jgi:hypothetical protein
VRKALQLIDKHRHGFFARTAKLTAWGVGLLLLATGSVQRALALPTLDQQNVFVSSIGDTANAFSQEIGQTFTVGIAGNLTQVDAYLARFPFTTDNLVFRLYSTDVNGLPDVQLGTDLFLAPAAVSDTAAAFESFDVSSFGVGVSVGDVLALVITSTGSTAYILPFSETDLYAGGQPVRRVLNIPPDPWQPNPGVVRDYGFRTYVEPIPEPGVMTLLGVAGVFGIRRRQNRRFMND